MFSFCRNVRFLVHFEELLRKETEKSLTDEKNSSYVTDVEEAHASFQHLEGVLTWHRRKSLCKMQQLLMLLVEALFKML